MKSKIARSLSFIAVAILLSGCNSWQSNVSDQNSKNMNQDKAQNADYISNTLSAKNQEEKSETKENVEKYTEKYNAAEIETNFGKIKVKFYNAEAPTTVNNFMKLSDRKFYDGTKFHRVIKDFMIQGGDPNSKDDDWSNDGMGGPGYKFQDEFNSHKLVRGSLAMANSGPNTNGSQFFIVTAASTPWLDGKHTNFGEVISGMDAVDKIENVSKNEKDHPTKDVTITNITLLNEK